MRRPVRLPLLLALVLALPLAAQTPAPVPYFPPRDDWQHRQPSDVGMDDALLADAVAYAQTQETTMPKDFSTQEATFGRPLGPVPKTRAGVNGVILRHGYVIAEFGDTRAVDPTYS